MTINELVKTKVPITDAIINTAGVKGDPIAIALSQACETSDYILKTDMTVKSITRTTPQSTASPARLFPMDQNLIEWFAIDRLGHAPVIGNLYFYQDKSDPDLPDLYWAGFEKTNQYVGIENLIRSIALETNLQKAVAREINIHTTDQRIDNPSYDPIDAIEELLTHGAEAMNWENLLFTGGCHKFVQLHMTDIEVFLSDYTETHNDDLTHDIRPGSGLLFTQIAQFTFEETARQIAGFLGYLDEGGQIVK